MSVPPMRITNATHDCQQSTLSKCTDTYLIVVVIILLALFLLLAALRSLLLSVLLDHFLYTQTHRWLNKRFTETIRN